MYFWRESVCPPKPDLVINTNKNIWLWFFWVIYCKLKFLAVMFFQHWSHLSKKMSTIFWLQLLKWEDLLIVFVLKQKMMHLITCLWALRTCNGRFHRLNYGNNEQKSLAVAVVSTLYGVKDGKTKTSPPPLPSVSCTQFPQGCPCSGSVIKPSVAWLLPLFSCWPLGRAPA